MLIIGCIFLILFICAVGYILNKHDVDIRIAALGVDFFQCVRDAAAATWSLCRRSAVMSA